MDLIQVTAIAVREIQPPGAIFFQMPPSTSPPVPPAPPIFQDIASINELASLLSCTAKQLRYLLYGKGNNKRYTEFTLNKRRGGVRTIRAPRADLKAIQRRLANFLQDRVSIRAAAHAFVRDRSIASNARLHVRRRTVLNIDLSDFFPTINFGRVRGLFKAQPFGAADSIATILAQICCYDNSLPQGAPTSPVISNLICYRLDTQLGRLAYDHRCIYTRYADDITFSKRTRQFPGDIASESDDGNIVLGSPLKNVIHQNGFVIHPEKVYLYHRTHRQTVTGLTVNERVNVPRRFVREMRAIIHDWKSRGLASAEATHHQQFYRHPDRLGAMPLLPRILSGKLSYLKMIRGVDDPVRRNLQKQFVAVYPEYQSVMEKENNQLTMRDLFISHASEDKPTFVRPLVDALIREGVSVWLDEIELTIGDDLAAKINDGLTKSRYGVVILSPNFFNLKKTWPDREVGALFAMEDSDKRPRVLPVWHNVDQSVVAAKNPMLAGKFAWRSSEFTTDELAVKFRNFMAARKSTP